MKSRRLSGKLLALSRDLTIPQMVLKLNGYMGERSIILANDESQFVRLQSDYCTGINNSLVVNASACSMMTDL